MNRHLASLALRRSLTPGFAVTAALVLALATRVPWAPSSEWSGAAQIRAGAFAREGVWTVLMLALLVVLVHKASSTVPRWRRGEVDWLAKSPANRTGIVVATWLGQAFAALLIVAAIALAAELTARDTQPALRLMARIPGADGALVDEHARLQWNVDLPPARAGDRLQVGVSMIANLPSAEVRFAAARRGSDGAVHRRETNAHVTAATSIEVEVPEGDGAVELELSRTGAIVALDGSGTTWLRPIGSASEISFDISAQVALAVLAWLALAFGCGAWVSPALATSTIVALALSTWVGGGSALDAWWPWSALPAAVGAAGRSVAPGMPTAAHVCGALACIALGLALARVNVATWRRSA